jgi:hypothetical protein
MIPMSQTPAAKKREEGLRVLARMIAETYRRDVAAGKVPDLQPKEVDTDIIPESAIVKHIEPGESGEGFICCEIVPITYFLRPHEKGKNEYGNRIRQGGQNATNQRNTK